MDFLKLTFAKLDPTEISELVVHESCGAVSMFAGTTRDNFDGKQVDFNDDHKSMTCNFANYFQGRFTSI